MLKTLTQFICDTCGKIIKSPQEGWLEWIRDSKTGKVHSFRIVHHQMASPLKNPEGCYQHGNVIGRSDDHLDHILANPTAELLMHLDIGSYHNPSFSGPYVADFRNYVETFRRLTIPYYEEARLYWDKAIQDGYFVDANELLIFTPSFLRELIARYCPNK